MPSNKQVYDKSEWRTQNFNFVRKHLYGGQNPTSKEALVWVEAFGGSGPVAVREAVEAGIIPDESFFVGIDNDAEVFWHYYMDDTLSEEERTQRRKAKRLLLGDIHREARHLAQESSIPVGVFNLDLQGQAGSRHYWTHDTNVLLQQAVEITLKRIPSCIVIFNYTAGNPRGYKGKDIAYFTREQHARIQEFLAPLKDAKSLFTRLPVPTFSEAQLQKLNYLYRSDEIFEYELDDVEIVGVGGIDSNTWNFYRAHNKTLPMVTTRIMIERK